MTDLWDSRYTPADAELIKAKVKRLISKHRYRRSDQEDLQQRLALHLWQRMKAYKPEIGDRRAFVHTILENEIANIIAHDTAQKRDLRRERPLPDHSDHIFTAADSKDQCNLRIDIDHLIRKMPKRLRLIARLYMHFSEAEIIEMTGMTRGQVRQRVRQIGTHFKKQGWL